MVVGDASCSGWVGAWDGRVAALDWADCGWARTAGDGGIGISVAPTLLIAVHQQFVAAWEATVWHPGDHGQLSALPGADHLRGDEGARSGRLVALTASSTLISFSVHDR